MAAEALKVEWRAIGESVRGASHVRAKLPNQDAIAWWPESGVGLPVVLAISDGHGSAKCIVSDVGAHLAVNTALAVMQQFFAGHRGSANLSAIKRTAEERLPQEIVRRWIDAVKEHHEHSPLPADRLDLLEKKEGMVARQEIQNNPVLAYGATIVVVLVTEGFILFMQDGDGDILTVSNTGEVTRPLATDERLFANETTSLCAPSAWRDFRVRFQALTGPGPALILLSTDGYANSFRNENGFLQVGSDILEMLRTEGLEKVNNSLKTWLAEASQIGSGDDITLGIISRTDVFNMAKGQIAQAAGELAQEPRSGCSRSEEH